MKLVNIYPSSTAPHFQMNWWHSWLITANIPWNCIVPYFDPIHHDNRSTECARSVYWININNNQSRYPIYTLVCVKSNRWDCLHLNVTQNCTKPHIKSPDHFKETSGGHCKYIYDAEQLFISTERRNSWPDISCCGCHPGYQASQIFTPISHQPF